MTDIYICFLCAQYGLYGNAPIAESAVQEAACIAVRLGGGSRSGGAVYTSTGVSETTVYGNPWLSGSKGQNSNPVVQCVAAAAWRPCRSSTAAVLLCRPAHTAAAAACLTRRAGATLPSLSEWSLGCDDADDNDDGGVAVRRARPL